MSSAAYPFLAQGGPKSMCLGVWTSGGPANTHLGGSAALAEGGSGSGGLLGHFLPLIPLGQGGQGHLQAYGGGVVHLAQAAQALVLDPAVEAALQGTPPQGAHSDGHHARRHLRHPRPSPLDTNWYRSISIRRWSAHPRLPSLPPFKGAPRNFVSTKALTDGAERSILSPAWGGDG